jgi:hypothetical protein
MPKKGEEKKKEKSIKWALLQPSPYAGFQGEETP